MYSRSFQWKTFIALLILFCFSQAASAAGAELRPEALPLHTDGATIRDAHGTAVRLVSVNWYGFDQGEYVVGGLDRVPLKDLVKEIRSMGFNSVRLPWANQIVEDNPAVPGYALNANPELRGKHSLEIMDTVSSP